jgi:copper chaperone CopZ
MNATLLLLSAVCSAADAAPAKVVEPHPVTATFYVAKVADPKAAAAIVEAVQKVPSVTKVEALTPESGFANVSFDSHAVSFHQIAEAIAAAGPEGARYEPTIKILLPDYATGENAAKIDEVFKKLEAKIKVVAADKEKGLFVVHFLPLKLEAEKKGPQGFNLGQIFHPVKDAAPKGLGLKATLIQEKPGSAK